MLVPQMYTRDGYEMHFQVNYLGHFLLTWLLLPSLKSASSHDVPSRVINVSSNVHRIGRVNFRDTQMQ
jgi:NAD(P)-dependent dehydrogenase (short-subunit alcohol dehydrogenase family)